MKPLLLLLLAAAGTTLYLQSRRRGPGAGVESPNGAEQLGRAHAGGAFAGAAQSLPRLVDEVRPFPRNTIDPALRDAAVNNTARAAG